MVDHLTLRSLHLDLVNTWLSRLSQEKKFTSTASQPFRGEVHATIIDCPCDCCLVGICLNLIVSGCLVCTFFFELEAIIGWKLYLTIGRVNCLPLAESDNLDI
jgi:hypothetical protein